MSFQEVNCCRQLIWKITLIGVLTALTVLIFSVFDKVNPADTDAIILSQEEKNWLAAHPIIHLIPQANHPPFIFVDQSEKPEGLSWDYVKLLEKKMGLRFSILKPQPLSSILNSVEKKEADLVASLERTEQREQYLKFTNHYISIPTVIIVKKNDTREHTLLGMGGMRVAVGESYGIHEFLLKKYPLIHTVSVKDDLEGLKGLSFGEVDAVIMDLASATFFIENKNIVNLRIAGEINYPFALSIAVRKDWPVLAGILDKGFAAITPEERKEIHSRWINLDVPFSMKREIFVLLLCAFSAVVLFAGFAWLRNRKIQKEIARGKNVESGSKKSHVDLEKGENLLEARLRLSEIALHLDFEKLMRATIDEAENLTQSSMGFFHFIDDNQENIILQIWSTNTLGDMCKTEGARFHYPVSKAGMWAECFRRRQPVIYQGQDFLSDKRGYPEGHPPVDRGLILPVIRDDKVKVIIGVGNKVSDYTEEDIFTVESLASFTMNLVERMKGEELIRKGKREWEKTFDSMSDIITIQDTSMRIVRANKAAHEAFGVEPGELNGRSCFEVFRGADKPCRDCPEIETLKDRQTHVVNINHENLGKIYHETSSPMINEYGELTHLIHIAKDITEHKRLEAELFQAHKMEAIGTLAGGIAHDYNNILAVILGNADMAKHLMSEDNPARYNIDQILKVSERAKELVQQILSFSRQTEHKLLPVEPCTAIDESLKLLRSTIPSTVSIIKNYSEEIEGTIMADPTQIHQLFMNLFSNAVHAMDDKGTIEVTVGIADLDSDAAVLPSGTKPGKYFQIDIADTGKGMDEEVRKRIFDPFYTTKNVNEGTGMGLSIVLGIVQTHYGFIRVDSMVGEGTVFSVYFPVVDKYTAEPKEVQKDFPGGHERVLFVDDEEMLAEMGGKILESLGYRVTVTSSSTDALKKFTASPDRFDLVITDQTMPDMSGIELSTELMKIKSDVLIILCTGYSKKVNEIEARKIGIRKYLKKPLALSQLAGSVREVLDNNVSLH